MKIEKWIINGSKPFQGWTQSYIKEDGLVAYTNKTFKEYNKEKGGVMKVITNTELNSLLKTHKKNMITDWVEVTENRYWEMLEVLPPVYRGVAFFVSEATYDTIHSCFIKYNGKFYESLRCIKNTEKTLIKSLINQLKTN